MTTEPGMRELIAQMPAHLRWAAELDVPAVPSTTEVLVCGMGGSGMSGDYLAGLTAATGKRVVAHRGYGLPGWAASVQPLVLALSYSGDTEETLSAVDRAAELELPVVAVTSGGRLARQAEASGWPLVEVPGGLQPRAALGYLLGASARVCGAAGVLPGVIDDLWEAASVVEELVHGGAARDLAADLAEALEGRMVGVYGSEGLTAPVATRWKTQINENAKWPAWAATLPEADHNEIVGWSGVPSLARWVGLVTLRDTGEHPAVARRFEVTAEVTRAEVAWVGEAWSQGSSLLARLMSLTTIGDLLSVELADLAGVDPMPVHTIEHLKRRLKEDTT